MEIFSVNTVIIGAGAVGLAIARELSLRGIETLVLEREDDFGKITSSRNSGVIHAGIYYPTNSLKARFCVEGNQFIYQYCKKFNIPHRNTKKILVASTKEQINVIDKIKEQAEVNGVKDIKKLSKKEVYKLEPLVNCEEALLIPSSGIIDPISFMRSLVGEIEEKGNTISYNSKVDKIFLDNDKFKILVKDFHENVTTINCKRLINSAGLFSSEVAKNIEGLDEKFIPKTYYAKGNYFSINKNFGIHHLIYPIPDGFGLGSHLTLEMDNSIKFGPDVEWVESPQDYAVDISRKQIFIKEIREYLPSIDTSLLTPAYAGIRPITNKMDKAMRDFEISDVNHHRVKNLINLFGIDSPGLTSSLSIAKYISDKLI